MILFDSIKKLVFQPAINLMRLNKNTKMQVGHISRKGERIADSDSLSLTNASIDRTNGIFSTEEDWLASQPWNKGYEG